jgi:basic amino acid/polyamine antiporter, APA family
VVPAMGAIAARGILESVSFAGVMTIIELGGLAMVIAAGFLFEPDIVFRLPEMLPLNGDSGIWSGIFTAFLLAVFAFIGFEGIVNIAEEVKDPSRTLPRAIIYTLLISTVLYVLVMWVALIAVGPAELAASEAPIALVFERLTGTTPRFMSAIAIVAVLNGIVVNIIMASRILYGLSRQGVLPGAFGRISPVTHRYFGAPHLRDVLAYQPRARTHQAAGRSEPHRPVPVPAVGAACGLPLLPAVYSVRFRRAGRLSR